MFTVDKEGDSRVITTLDARGEYPDVEVIYDPHEVYIRQWDENFQEFSVIVMSHQQYRDIRIKVEEI